MSTVACAMASNGVLSEKIIHFRKLIYKEKDMLITFLYKALDWTAAARKKSEKTKCVSVPSIVQYKSKFPIVNISDHFGACSVLAK